MPWDSRPVGAREINVDASAFGFSAATTPAVIPGSAFTVPADNVGIIRSISFNCNTLLTTSIIRWSFRADGVPIEGWNQLSIFPRNAGFAAQVYGPDETWLFLETGQTVDVTFTVDPADPNVYQAGITYHGWSYPKRLHDLFSSVYLF